MTRPPPTNLTLAQLVAREYAGLSRERVIAVVVDNNRQVETLRDQRTSMRVDWT